MSPFVVFLCTDKSGSIQLCHSVKRNLVTTPAKPGSYQPGAYAVKSAGATAAARSLTANYIEGSGMNADGWLKAHGVTYGYDGLDFSGSTMFCDTNKQMIDIVVSYDIDLQFLGFVLPQDKLHVIQRVSVPAWLDGDGKTY